MCNDVNIIHTKNQIINSNERTMYIVSFCVIMFLLFGNRDNQVGYYQFSQSNKL